MKIRNIVFFAFLLTFSSFSLSATEAQALTTLDTYLFQNGFALSPVHSARNEGYSSEAQRKAFKEDCQAMLGLKKILEIGFNGGHSCEAFLESGNEVAVISFDLNSHPYAQTGANFMFKKYPGRFQFIPGDSSVTVNAYAASHPDEKFDLIFIDGCHEHNAAVRDIQNCQKLAHRKTVVWIDDYASYGVKPAVDQCVNQGLLQILKVKSVNDQTGVRVWAIARYRYLTECERAFSTIYETGGWGRDALGRGTSGPGSTLAQGKAFVDFVQKFIDTHEINTIVDVGCGDWVLAQHIDWGDRDYLGIDVVASVIERNQVAHGTDKIHFAQLDGSKDPLPSGDLLICKDVFIHLPNANIQHILSESKKFKYCIFVNDTLGDVNRDIKVGGFHPLDLTQQPFNLVPAAINNYYSEYVLKQMLIIKN